MIIEYCEACGLRISEAELQDGQSVKVDGKSFHTKCAPAQSVKKGSGRIGAVGTPSPGSEIVAPQGDSRGSKAGIRPARRDSKASIPRPATSAMQSPGTAAANPNANDPNVKTNSHAKWFIIGGSAAAVIGIGLIIAFSGSPPEQPDKKTASAAKEKPAQPNPAPAQTQPPAVDLAREPHKSETVALKFEDKQVERPNAASVDRSLETMRIERAAKLLDEAKAFAKEHPEDVRKYHEKLTTVATTYRSTPAADEAAKLIAEVKLPEIPTIAMDDPAWKDAVNVLSQVDVAKDSVNGTWKMESGALKCDKGKETRLHLPYAPGEEYDLRVVFTRQEGGEGMVHFLTYAGKSFIFVLSSDYNKVAAFAMVKNQPSNANPSSVKLKLENNRKYTLVVQVRAEGVRAFLDGKMVTEWLDYKDITTPSGWKFRSDTVLGLGSQNSKITYHSIDVLDQKGTGKTQRDVSAATTAVGNPAPPAKTEPAKPAVDESALAAATAKVEGEKLLADVHAMLSKEGTAQALAKLEKGLADKQLAPMKAELEMEMQMAKTIDELNKAALDGAKTLVDKRPYTFKRSDGKEVVSGKGTNVSVVGVKDDAIEIEESAGGGKIQAKIDLDVLSASTRYELARMGLPPGPESFLKLAYGGFVLLDAGSNVVTLKDVRNSLEQARKGQASPEKVKYLVGRLEFYELDLGGEAAFRKVEAIAKEKKWEAAKTALEDYRREYLGTRSMVKLAPEIEKLNADIELALAPLKPGLWASYWTLDSKEKPKAKVLARPETKISENWGLGSPDKAVPVDYFGILFAGLLRVEQEGKYKFLITADDKAGLKIDGKTVKHNDDVRLTKGDHEIQIVYGEGEKNANLSVKWKPENGTEQDLPPTALFYDPKLIEKYEKR